MEQEVMEFVYALVRLFKPRHVIETGTGGGYGTLAIARALDINDSGDLTTIEINPDVIDAAKTFVIEQCPICMPCIQFLCGDSLEVIRSLTCDPFDFAVIDSVIERRITEFEALMANGLLAKGAICIFHDTSRLRGGSMHDFDQGFIDKLDELSIGSQWLESPLSRGLRLLRLP
jgi:predicted O-methyltransferase YrrM